MSTRKNRFDDKKINTKLSLKERKTEAKELFEKYESNKDIKTLEEAIEYDNTNNEIVYNYLLYLKHENEKINIKKDNALKERIKKKFNECLNNFKVCLSTNQLKKLGCNEKSQKDIFYDLIEKIKDAKVDNYDEIVNKLNKINDKIEFNNNISIDNLNLCYYSILVNLKNIILRNEFEENKKEEKLNEENKNIKIKNEKDEEKKNINNIIIEKNEIEKKLDEEENITKNKKIKIEEKINEEITQLKTKLKTTKVYKIIEFYKKKNLLKEKEKGNFNLFFFSLLRAEFEKLIDFSRQFDEDEKEKKLNYNFNEDDNKSEIINNFTEETFNENKDKIRGIKDYDYKVQKYLRLSKFNKTHFNKKYLDIIKNFFKEILKSTTIKSLIEFIYYSEYINCLNLYSERIIDEIFEQIYFLPYELEYISAMSDADSCSIFTSGLILVPKGYTTKNLFENPEVKILNFGKITIILTHEIIGHIIKIYLKKLKLTNEDNSPSNNNLYNKLKTKYGKNKKLFEIVQEFKKNIDKFDDDEEGGNQIEIFLYGEIKNTVSINECLYLLDLNNYKKHFNDFKNDFVAISKKNESDKYKYKVNDFNGLLTKDLYYSLLSNFDDIIVKSFNIKHKFKKGNFNSLTIEFGRCGTNQMKKKRGRVIKLSEFKFNLEDYEEDK